MEFHIPFGWFYLFNLILMAVFLAVYGLRKGYPPSVWFTVLAWVSVFFLIGLKLLNFPVTEWRSIIFSDSDEPVFLKFAPGGVLFFVLGLVLIRVLLKFRGPVMDGLILVLPLVVAVQRLGCFLNGCCYGRPSALPWAVHYAPGTPAYGHYLESGLVQPGDAVSCGIHPAQLYTVFGALLVFAVLWRFRHSWRSAGGRVLFGMILLMGMRFLLEFFRETQSWKWFAGEFMGLNYLQWMIGVLLVTCSVVLFFRERRIKAQPEIFRFEENAVRNALSLLLLLLIFWNCRRLFIFPELVLAGALLLIAGFLTLIRLFRPAGSPAVRYAGVLLLTAFVTMSQEVIREERDSIRNTPDKFWISAGLRGSGGRYEEINRDCDGNITDRRNKGQVAGSADLVVHYQPQPAHLFDYGLNAWVIRDRYIEGAPEPVVNWGISPFIRYNQSTDGRNSLEIMAGATYSPTRYLGTESGWTPNLYLRLGPRDRFFIDAGIGNELLMTGKPNLFQAGIGTGLKSLPGSTLRFGMSFGPESSDLFGSRITDDDGLHLYLAGDLKFRNGLSLKPGIYIINQAFGTIGVSYNFGHR